MENITGDADASQLIDRLGGTGRTAEICDTSASAVSQWRRNGIPKPRLQFLRLAHPEAFVERGDQARDGASS
ncbi:hypothetical protein [Burkholderia ubonensis]|uniref:hypothetical protein n=1 Tax=Burkholderia ubonensis TaxID=101571 RepID=UPI0009B4D466|nr:hypothetical protein [Burkholderia ubonensis]